MSLFLQIQSPAEVHRGAMAISGARLGSKTLVLSPPQDSCPNGQRHPPNLCEQKEAPPAHGYSHGLISIVTVAGTGKMQINNRVGVSKGVDL